ncbi:hypothetical protein NE237_002264 [Protea cynaroides]|uniref:Uncharacterized protein n=1 Tax=Protea cynaroides TaxID=273540 RepID=A0A9Q0QYW7_9MAGN|nr:hypothetical protein NE237_002264 [Protea cynaroides]
MPRRLCPFNRDNRWRYFFFPSLFLLNLRFRHREDKLFIVAAKLSPAEESLLDLILGFDGLGFHVILIVVQWIARAPLFRDLPQECNYSNSDGTFLQHQFMVSVHLRHFLNLAHFFSSYPFMLTFLYRFPGTASVAYRAFPSPRSFVSQRTPLVSSVSFSGTSYHQIFPRRTKTRQGMEEPKWF